MDTNILSNLYYVDVREQMSLKHHASHLEDALQAIRCGILRQYTFQKLLQCSQRVFVQCLYTLIRTCQLDNMTAFEKCHTKCF